MVPAPDSLVKGPREASGKKLWHPDPTHRLRTSEEELGNAGPTTARDNQQRTARSEAGDHVTKIAAAVTDWSRSGPQGEPPDL